MDQTLTPAVKAILLTNVAVFVVQYLLIPDLSFYFGLRYLGATEFQIWQPFTFMFTHGGIGHLFSNMIGLFFFGPVLEKVWGTNKFFLFYLLASFGGVLLFMGFQTYELMNLQSLLNTFDETHQPEVFMKLLKKLSPGLYNANFEFIDFFQKNPENQGMIAKSSELLHQVFDAYSNVPLVGASGSIFGILVAFGYYFPNVNMYMFFIPVPIKAKYLITFYVGYEIYEILRHAPDDNIAHLAHIGGAVVGFLMAKYTIPK